MNGWWTINFFLYLGKMESMLFGTRPRLSHNLAKVPQLKQNTVQYMGVVLEHVFLVLVWLLL